jgi:hypothetical protein
MSLARTSASGPTTTWTTAPARMTPCTPASLSVCSSMSELSASSVRSRVIQASTSTMLALPPRPATICSAWVMKAFNHPWQERKLLGGS